MKTRAMAGVGLTVTAGALILTGASTATGEGNVCAPRDNVVSQLGQQFQESQEAIGVLGEDAIVEVFVSQQGSWTILVTDTQGNSCIMAAGEGWDGSFENATEAAQGV